MSLRAYGTPGSEIKRLGIALRNFGETVVGNYWQGVKAPAPMWELYGPSFRARIPDPPLFVRDIKPNLPWADQHFEERVSGIPYNPPPSAAIWPFNPRSAEFRLDEIYSHTYPERIWPKYAGLEESESATSVAREGIRYEYGDLCDVVDLLKRDPLTRQAFLPIWFPEDTGAVHGGRVPCTLGYLFMRRNGYLHCTYYIRSCDYFRHLRDDVYLSCQLTYWVLQQVKWDSVQLGYLDMHIASLHCWESEKTLLPR